MNDKAMEIRVTLFIEFSYAIMYKFIMSCI